MEWWDKGTLSQEAWQRHLEGWGALHAPLRDADGVVRLQPLTAGREPVVEPARLAVTKYLLPPRETLWREVGGRCTVTAPPAPLVVLGIVPCDLYAVGWLDRIFADDLYYCRRRAQLVLIGATCQPHEGCACPPRSENPPCDLFDDGDRIWSASLRGAAILAPLDGRHGDGELPSDSPWRVGARDLPANGLAEAFAAAAQASLWREVAGHCLACGACSALCPTCTCFDMHDLAALDGSAERVRIKDNCFFPEHGLVAGGHNFRPDRASRLRFRFEHKYLGFGDERGEPSCVGCGRCAAGCPAGIDLNEILADLVTRRRT